MKAGFLNSSSNETSKLRENKLPSNIESNKLNNFYKERLIGEGNFCEVFLVSRNEDGKNFALKVYEKHRVIKLCKVRDLQVERHVMNKLKLKRHKNIIYLYETFQHKEKLYFLYEYAEDGELWDKIRTVGLMDEKLAKFFICQIVNAVHFLHKNFIIHRDIKCENIVLRKNGLLKLIDFGTAVDLENPNVKPAYISFSCNIRRKLMKNRRINSHTRNSCVKIDEPKENYDNTQNNNNNRNCLNNKVELCEKEEGKDNRTNGENEEEKKVNNTIEEVGAKNKKKKNVFLHYIGTPQFLPPECLKDQNSKEKRDIWHLGCTIYQLLVGVPPFLGSTEWFIYNNIQDMNIIFPPYISDEAKDLIQQMMNEDYSKRINFDLIKKHRFFKDVFHFFDDSSLEGNLESYEDVDKDIHEYYANYFHSERMKNIHQKVRYLVLKFEDFCRKNIDTSEEVNKEDSKDEELKKEQEEKEQEKEQEETEQEETEQEEKEQEEKVKEPNIMQQRSTSYENLKEIDKNDKEVNFDLYTEENILKRWHSEHFSIFGIVEDEHVIFNELQKRFEFLLSAKVKQKQRELIMHNEWLKKCRQESCKEENNSKDNENIKSKDQEENEL